MLKKDAERKANTDFFTVEAYKLARTNIALSIIKNGCKKILITSPLPSEGKTTTACNIAAAFSKQVNSRTLLIDCDLRKPSVSRFFRIKNTPGITNYLGGMNTLDEVIQNVPNTELSVICAGIIPPNPSELLSSSQFAEMIEELEKRFDYIIIDTSPINIVSDAIPITKLVDGVVTVIFEQRSTYAELEKTVQILNRHEAKILGIVLNGSKSKENAYKNKNQKRYGRYGYDSLQQ